MYLLEVPLPKVKYTKPFRSLLQCAGYISSAVTRLVKYSVCSDEHTSSGEDRCGFRLI